MLTNVTRYLPSGLLWPQASKKQPNQYATLSGTSASPVLIMLALQIATTIPIMPCGKLFCKHVAREAEKSSGESSRRIVPAHVQGETELATDFPHMTYVENPRQAT
jgi:hypothetical protein